MGNEMRSEKIESLKIRMKFSQKKKRKNSERKTLVKSGVINTEIIAIIYN